MAKDHEEQRVFVLSKLRFPMLDVEEKGAGAVDMVENLKRVCRICHKEFKSAKALGGHTRIHFQKAQQQKQQSLNVKKLSCCGRVEEKEKPICSICGRDFKSMKSLFGHMRCHPNRGWRGIHHPSSKLITTSNSSHSSSSLSSCGAAELSRWGARGRRGRQATEAGASSEASSSEDKEMLRAAYYLMVLSSDRICCESKAEVVQRSHFREWEYLAGDSVASGTHHYNQESGNKPNDNAMIFGFDLNELAPSEEGTESDFCW